VKLCATTFQIQVQAQKSTSNLKPETSISFH